MHYYPHHIGDFVKETSNLNDHQLATYLRMIWAYYLDEKPLPDDCERIAFAVRSDEKTVRVILKHYFELHDDGWHQNRCDKEIEHYRSNSEKAKKAADARWNKHNQKQQMQSERNADVMHMHTKTDAYAMVFDANQEPITKNKKNSSSNDERFNEFWDAFSNKRGKGGAERAWKRINPDNQLAEQIIAGAKRYVKARGTDSKYWKQAQGWLNDRRWEDEIEPVLALVNDTFAGSL